MKMATFEALSLLVIVISLTSQVSTAGIPNYRNMYPPNRSPDYPDMTPMNQPPDYPAMNPMNQPPNYPPMNPSPNYRNMDRSPDYPSMNPSPDYQNMNPSPDYPEMNPSPDYPAMNPQQQSPDYPDIKPMNSPPTLEQQGNNVQTEAEMNQQAGNSPQSAAEPQGQGMDSPPESKDSVRSAPEYYQTENDKIQEDMQTEDVAPGTEEENQPWGDEALVNSPEAVDDYLAGDLLDENTDYETDQEQTQDQFKMINEDQRQDNVEDQDQEADEGKSQSIAEDQGQIQAEGQDQTNVEDNQSQVNAEEQIQADAEDQIQANAEDQIQVNAEDQIQVIAQDQSQENAEDQGQMNLEAQSQSNPEDQNQMKPENQNQMNPEDQSQANLEDQSKVAYEDSPMKVEDQDQNTEDQDQMQDKNQNEVSTGDQSQKESKDESSSENVEEDNDLRPQFRSAVNMSAMSGTYRDAGGPSYDDYPMYDDYGKPPQDVQDYEAQPPLPEGAKALQDSLRMPSIEPTMLPPDYCTLGENHTMCMYKPDACQKDVTIAKNRMTVDDVEIALGIHNFLREQVSYGRVKGLPAADPAIPPLQWDPDLQDIAQRWADQCNLQHDFNRRTEKYVAVGQNMYWMGSTGTLPKDLWKRAVESWFDELTEFLEKGGDVTKFGASKSNNDTFWKGVGSFTQVIWSTTLYVGCGQMIVRDTHDELRYQAYLVCNYAPTGNIIERPIYSTPEVPIQPDYYRSPA